MNRRMVLFTAAAALAAATASALDPGSKPGTPPAETEPRDPAPPFSAPSQTIPQPAAGTPQPPAVPPNEGTGRPGAAKADEALIQAVRDALGAKAGAPGIENLLVTALDGKVVLGGTVRTQRDKDAVTAKAGAVAGLRNVTNNITVKP